MRIKSLILLLCPYFCLTAGAQVQKEKTEAYINNYKELAISEMIRTGVPAAIKLAQGILESQYGESDLAKNVNNHFGIKCKTEWTGARTYHDDDARGECFRAYGSAEESYRDHSDFLRSRPHYAFLFLLDPADYGAWAYGLKKAGYATSATYTQRLLRVITDYNLQHYSLLAIARQGKQAPPGSNTAMPEVANAKETTAPVAALMGNGNGMDEKTGEIAAMQQKEDTAIALQVIIPASKEADKNNTGYPQGVFTINHTKVIYVSEGKSLLSLANQFSISLSKLLDFNELSEMDVLDRNRLLFIERKQKRGASDFHIANGGETLHDIAQKEGIRMENLLEYNKLNSAFRPATGQKLYLRSTAGETVKTNRSTK